MNDEKYIPLIPQIKEMLSTIIDALWQFKSYQEKKKFPQSEEILNMCSLSLEAILSAFNENLALNSTNIKFLNCIASKLTALQENYSYEVFVNLLEDIHYLSFFAENYELEIMHSNANCDCINNSKKKILFVPYKASMWDSMDSIYRAAINDENCEVFVVPAPYFIVKDNDIQKYEYEGYDLDKNINITHWQDPYIYAVEFDAIYFHNPYDTYNTVSRVHSRFQSDALRQWCDALIFTPYGIGIDSFDTVEESKNIYIAGLFKFPALQRSDIVLSNTICEKEFLEKQGISSKKLFRASPKLDYAIKINTAINEVPNEWERKLKNKAIFLVGLNIRYISTAYNEAMKIIEMIINTPKCGLIFRPHPFLKEFLEGVDVKVSQHFYSVIEKIRKSPNAVYDDTASYVAAFQASHALFNDFSSIMPMYMVNEKPVYQYIEPYLNKEFHVIDYTSTYGASKNLSIQDFISLVKTKNDYLKEERLSKFYTSIGNTGQSDITDGARVHNHVMSILKKASIQNKHVDKKTNKNNKKKSR